MKKLAAPILWVLLLSLCACSGQTGGTERETVSPEPEISAQEVSESPSQEVEPSLEPSEDPAEETVEPQPSEEVQPSPAASETPAPVPSSAPASEPTPTPTSTSTPTPEPSLAADPKAVAIELSKRRAPVSELYAAIGQPNFSEYGPGCLEPDSEDGELYYDGFTVYTVRTDAGEYVYDVL